MNNDWVNWKGGKCPLPDGVKTDILFRNGDHIQTTDLSNLSWRHIGSDSDIIAYRAVDKTEPTQTGNILELPETESVLEKRIWIDREGDFVIKLQGRRFCIAAEHALRLAQFLTEQTGHEWQEPRKQVRTLQHKGETYWHASEVKPTPDDQDDDGDLAVRSNETKYGCAFVGYGVVTGWWRRTDGELPHALREQK